jgi:DNA-binding NtrC family response regulator
MSKGKILIVDDEEVCRLFFSDFLSRAGYSVNVCENGLEAIECFKVDRPDVVLMDVRMPKISGNKTLRIMKDIDCKVPVVMMSAYTTVDVVVNCMKLGAENMLKKPGDIEKVIRIIDNAINNHRIADNQKTATHPIQGSSADEHDYSSGCEL